MEHKKMTLEKLVEKTKELKELELNQVRIVYEEAMKIREVEGIVSVNGWYKLADIQPELHISSSLFYEFVDNGEITEYEVEDRYTAYYPYKITAYVNGCVILALVDEDDIREEDRKRVKNG